MANKQGKDSGFKRGFLLGKPKKKKKPTTTGTSSTLKGQTVNVNLTTSTKSETGCQNTSGQKENSNLPTKVRSSALLNLETDNPSNNSKSLFHFLESTSQPQTPKDSGRTRSSILLVNNNDESENDTRDETNLMMTEVASSVRRKGSQIASLDFSADRPKPTTTQTNSDNLQQLNQPLPVTKSTTSDNNNHRDHNSHPDYREHDDDTTPTTKDTTSFLQCQQDLDQTLWHLRRRRRRPHKQERSNSDHEENPWRDTALEFSRNLIMTNDNTTATNNLGLLSFVWETLLEKTPKQTPHCLAELRLGWALLESTQEESAWQVFSGFLVPRESKSDRILTLGAITMVDFWCSQNQQTPQTTKWMEDLLQHVVTPLGQQVMWEQTRTVLAQRSMLAIYNSVSTVAASCFALDNAPDNNHNQQLQTALWGISSDVLLPVWDKHMAWNDMTDSSRDASCGIESQSATARNKCTTCVLQSWKDLLIELQGRNDLAEAYNEWCQLLVGVKLPADSEVRIGSLRQTLSKDEVVWTPDDILPLLRQALDSGRQVTVDNDKSTTAQARDKQLGIVRGIVAWLGQRKKNYLPSNYDQVFEISSSLIQFALSDSVVHLAMQILKMLWLDSAGIPPDIAKVYNVEDEEENTDDLPSSFKYWVRLLKDSGCDELADNNNHAPSLPGPRETSVECLCHLIATSILCICSTSLDYSKEMVSYVVSQKGMTASTVQVLTMILRKSANTKSNGNDRVQVLLDHIAGRLLLEDFHSNSSVRDFIRRAQLEEVDLFAGCSVRPVISREIRLLASSVDAGDSLDDSASAIVLSLLTESLWRNLKHGSTKLLIEAVVEELISLSDSVDNGEKVPTGKAAPNKRIDLICNQLGEEWRRSLLGEAGDIYIVNQHDDTVALGTVLSTVGVVMFQHASSTIPLTLFGALLGDGNSLGFDSPNKRRKEAIVNTAMSLIQMSVSELDRLHLEHMKSAQGGTAEDEGQEIFSRLAPLLLLRRAPPRLFHEAYSEIVLRQINYPQQAEMKNLLKGLAVHLADRLDIKSAPSTESKADGFTAQERQMAAEVAGRCLPFNEDLLDAATGVQSFSFQGASCFQRIGLPGFFGVLELINTSAEGGDDGARDRIRRARAALYSACHFVPFATGFDNEYVGEALVGTASFCLHILDVEQDRFESSALDQDFLQLQTGCIEFFAVCVEARHTIILGKKPTETRAASTIELSLQRIYESLVEVVQTGTLKKADRFGNGPLTQLPETTKSSSRSYSTPCITCLWNALIVVSQRCPEEGNRLQVLVKAILPRLVTWGASTMNGPNAESKKHRHPLCFTAALQLAFILATRSKSFGGIPSTAPSTNVPDEGVSVQQLYRWSLYAVQKAKGSDDYANKSLRCAGLKVMLAVCTICQEGNGSSAIERGSGPTLILSERDRRDTCSAVEHIALQDTDERNRVLASHVLSAVVGRRPH